MVNVDNLTEKEKEALAAAAKAIYFNDGSDYLVGLWEVVNAITDETTCDAEDDDDFINEIAQHFIGK